MDQVAATPSSHLRVSLREILLWTVWAAIGLTVAARFRGSDAASNLGFATPSVTIDWQIASMATASAAIAFGLMRQIRAIRRQVSRRTDLDHAARSAYRFEIFWRVAIAVLLGSLLLLHFCTLRGFLSPPERDSLFSDGFPFSFIWQLLLLIVISEAEKRRRALKRRRRGYALINVLAIGGLLALVFYWAVDLALIPYLVHLACQNVDGTLAYTGNRYPTASHGDELVHFMGATAAVLGLLLGAECWRRALLSPSGRGMRRRWLGLAGGFLIGAAACFAIWHYGRMPETSPDLAGVGLATTWLEQLGGVLLGVLTAAIGAALITTQASQTDDPASAERLELPPASDSLPVLTLMLVPPGIIVVAFFTAGLPPLEHLGYILSDFHTPVMVATLFASLPLLYRRLRGSTLAPLQLSQFSFPRFGAAWLAWIVILAVGAPTLSAFGFLFWLGPWYRW